jgi:type VI protein secretion system component VasF
MTEEWPKRGAEEWPKPGADDWPRRRRLTHGVLAALFAAAIVAIWLLLGAPA